MRVPLFRLQCGVNNYDWGKVGSASAAAKYAAATPAEGFSISEEKPYAELWMGTHPSNPSKDVTTGRTLLDLFEENEALLNSDVAKKYGRKLPFLFKVLSINKALSIQAHPDKRLAEQLHARDPKNYPDDNHKPEMTIAITPFTGLCGFRPLSEVAHFMETVPALRKLIGDSQATAFTTAMSGKELDEIETESEVTASKKMLKDTFTVLMNSSEESIAAATMELLQEVAKGAEFAGGIPEAEELSRLIPMLNSQFPDDIGTFVLFFLNYVKLSPGEAMFLKANDIHAYISGDIIECMAASDNVIRAGFTPKFKDVSTLTSSLTYNYASPEKQKLEPKAYSYATLNAAAYSSESICEVYDPPIEEFSVVRTLINRKGRASFDGIPGPSVIICTGGSGKISVGPEAEEVKEGYVFFVGATASVVLEADGDGFETFRAYCELADEGKL